MNSLKKFLTILAIPLGLASCGPDEIPIWTFDCETNACCYDEGTKCLDHYGLPSEDAALVGLMCEYGGLACAEGIRDDYNEVNWQCDENDCNKMVPTKEFPSAVLLRSQLKNEPECTENLELKLFKSYDKKEWKEVGREDFYWESSDGEKFYDSYVDWYVKTLNFDEKGDPIPTPYLQTRLYKVKRQCGDVEWKDFTECLSEPRELYKENGIVEIKPGIKYYEEEIEIDCNQLKK